MILHRTFSDLVGKYCDDDILAGRLWAEIVACHSEEGRHYHTLAHLEFMLDALDAVWDTIHDRDAVSFALFYHDIVYIPGREDNETQSAALAGARLAEIGFPQTGIEKVVRWIMATRHHTDTGERDADTFLDADLSSGLARSQEAHREVSRQIRQEYAAYPDAVFNAGRAQIIRHFLEMPWIFKTPGFQDRFERRARENLQTELACLAHVDAGGDAS